MKHLVVVAGLAGLGYYVYLMKQKKKEQAIQDAATKMVISDDGSAPYYPSSQSTGADYKDIEMVA